jgi:rSAM/selenodomain-associated transferase 2
MMSRVSVIIPVYRDTESLARTLSATDFRQADVIVAATAEEAASLAEVRVSHPDIVWIEAPRGRARQMNAGAAIAHGAWLLFLHADTLLPEGWQRALATAAADPRVVAGCFRFALDSPSRFARAIELGVAVRVRLFGMPYGDQALFVRRDVFERIGGYADVPIMEDVDLVRRLRRVGRLWRSPLPAVTSARRWERDGWVRRTARHLQLILLYLAGVRPARLASLDPSRSPETSSSLPASNHIK